MRILCGGGKVELIDGGEWPELRECWKAIEVVAWRNWRQEGECN